MCDMHIAALQSSEMSSFPGLEVEKLDVTLKS